MFGNNLIRLLKNPEYNPLIPSLISTLYATANNLGFVTDVSLTWN